MALGLLLAKRRSAEAAMNVALNLAGTTFVLTAAGLASGLLLRVFGGDPSWCYRAASFVWLIVGWPTLAVSIWQIRRRPPAATHFHLRRIIFSLVGLTCLVVLLFKLAFSGNGPMTELVRGATTYAFDGVTPLLATDECLAVRRIEYLTWRRDKELDAARLPGYVIEAELGARAKYLDRRIYATALHGYRMKVRRGEIHEPETLDDAACPGCPGVEQELRDWIADEGHTEASRALAEYALSGTLYPPEEPKRRRSAPDPDRMLRYPRRSP